MAKESGGVPFPLKVQHSADGLLELWAPPGLESIILTQKANCLHELNAKADEADDE